jgi:hypothetical protein
VNPSIVGIADQVQGDGDMMMGGGRRIVVGAAELNFKRDHMEIQPLFQEPGISKICNSKTYSQF